MRATTRRYLEQSLAEHERQWEAYKQQEAEIRRMKQDIARTMEQARSVERSTTPRQPNVRRVGQESGQQSEVARKETRSVSGVRRARGKAQTVVADESGFRRSAGKRQRRAAVGEVSVGYGERVLLRDVSLSIRHGERIALIGENGTGKSTLIKTIVGQLQPLAGEVRLGVNVRVGYFAQEQDVLDPNSTPLESLQASVPMNETEARSFLHFFLFTGDQPLTLNQSLSYGERARLMLALLVAQGCNFLILDEPINHLDIPSRTQFEKALTNFEGTALAVVHDRYFIQGFASRIWAVEGAAGERVS